jgi:hypothetical protein
VRRWLLALSILLTTAGAAEAQPPPTPKPCVPNSDSTSFNATTDAHKVGLVDMKPGADYDSAPRLTAAIAYVVGNPSCRNLVVDPGTYYFYSANAVRGQKAKSTYVYVPQATGLTIDLRGANLIFKESYFTAFYIDKCNMCTFSNFSIDYQHLPFTQLDVKNVHADEITADPQPGWPSPPQLYAHQADVGGAAANIKFQGFDTRDGVPQYGYMPWKLSTPPQGRAHRIAVDPKDNPQGVVKKGDVFIVAARGGGPAIDQQSGSATTFKDITIYTSGGPGIESWNSQTTSFIGIRIVPKPNTGRLVSTVAGGIELNNMIGGGFVVRDCVIEGAQDDSIAGNATAPSAAAGMTRELITTAGVPPPNPVFFMNRTTGVAVGGPNTPHQFDLTLVLPPSSYSVSPGLNWDQLALAGNDAFIYGVNLFGKETGVTVENNTISNSYLARGIGFTGVSNLSITRNTVINTQQAGIYVGVQLPANVPTDRTLIEGNTLTGTNLGMSGVGPHYLGAIEVMAYAADGDVIAPQLSRHVFINKNTVDTTQRAGIWIGNVHGGAVNDNEIKRYGRANGNLGHDPKLNDGLGPNVGQAFASALLAWCTADIASNGNRHDVVATNLCLGSSSQLSPPK